MIIFLLIVIVIILMILVYGLNAVDERLGRLIAIQEIIGDGLIYDRKKAAEREISN